MEQETGPNGQSPTSDDGNERVRDAVSDHEETWDRGNRRGPHDIPGWECDPGLELPALALGEPDETRSGAVALGQTTQGVARRDFNEKGGPFTEFYMALAAIRANAVRSHVEHLIGPLRKKWNATKTREAIESAAGEQAADQARRLEDETPRYERDVEKHRDELHDAEEAREQKQLAVERLHDDAAAVDPEETAGEPEPRPRIAEKIGLTGRKLVMLMTTETTLAFVVLHSPVLRAIPTTLPWESYVIAASLALVFQAAAFCGGRLMAAIELPQRFIAAFFTVCFSYTLARFVPAITALREGSSSGAAALTWVSVMVATVAAATGWTSALSEGFERRLAAFRTSANRMVARIREQIAFAELKVAKATGAVEDATTRLTEAQDALEAHREKITELWRVVEHTPVRKLGERLAGEEAVADMATEENIRDHMVDSEEQHRDWLIRIARLSRLKTRSEELRNALATATWRSASEPGATHRHAALLVAAVVALGAGAIVGTATHSTVLLAVGVGLAALLFGVWLWSQRARQIPLRSVDKEAVQSLIGSSVLKSWTYLATRLKPSYSGPNPTESEKV